MSDATWAIGSEPGGYRLLRDFGRDASSDLFLAENPAGRHVVIRAMHEELAADRCKLMDFYHQGKLAMSVEHPRVLQVLEVAHADGRHFAASEFLGLPSLKYQLKHGLPEGKHHFEEHEAVRIVLQLAKILQDLHEDRSRPIVHRGIAPANVLLDKDGQPILSGLQWGSSIEHPLPYPAEGVTAELFQYLAPEQIAEREHSDPRADVYSLGALFYTLLTGRIPFKGKDAEETLRKKKRHEFLSPEMIVPGLSRSVVQIVRECLRADPDRRPQSMRRLREFMDSGNRVVGGYRLKSYLGSGNTGDVYQAISPRGHDVAVKLVTPKIARDQKRLKRFYRGAKVSIQVSHPHLLEGLEVNQDGGQHFLATELVPGENLMWLIQKHGALPEHHVLKIGIQVASALEHIHELNLVHRDIKPSNILIEPNGRAKLADLGFAKFMEPEEQIHDVTRAGRPLGTCQYIPPEQVSSAKDVDFRGDLYSLGVTMFVLLTGKLPFKSGGTLEMLMDKAINRFPTARQVNPEVSDATSRLIHWMMQAEPENRPQSAESVLRAAQECLSRLESQDPDSPSRVRKEEHIVVDNPKRHTSPAVKQHKRAGALGIIQRLALGIGVLFVAMVAGLLLVKF